MMLIAARSTQHWRSKSCCSVAQEDGWFRKAFLVYAPQSWNHLQQGPSCIGGAYTVTKAGRRTTTKPGRPCCPFARLARHVTSDATKLDDVPRPSRVHTCSRHFARLARHVTSNTTKLDDVPRPSRMRTCMAVASPGGQARHQQLHTSWTMYQDRAGCRIAWLSLRPAGQARHQRRRHSWTMYHDWSG